MCICGWSVVTSWLCLLVTSNIYLKQHAVKQHYITSRVHWGTVRENAEPNWGGGVDGRLMKRVRWRRDEQSWICLQLHYLSVTRSLTSTLFDQLDNLTVLSVEFLSYLSLHFTWYMKHASTLYKCYKCCQLTLFGLFCFWMAWWKIAILTCDSEDKMLLSGCLRPITLLWAILNHKLCIHDKYRDIECLLITIWQQKDNLNLKEAFGFVCISAQCSSNTGCPVHLI